MTSQTNSPLETRPPTFVAQLVEHVRLSILAMIVLLILVSGVYPLLVWGIGQAIFHHQANGSLVDAQGNATNDPDQAVGSSWIGQGFAASQYFHPRSSAAGNGYDPTSSAGTNLGPTSDKLINGVHGQKNPDGTAVADFTGVKDLVAAYRSENHLPPDFPVPADAATYSASGLDPHISLENARLQAQRIADKRGIPLNDVQTIISSHTDSRSLGVLGDPCLNVLMANLDLDRQHPMPATRP